MVHCPMCGQRVDQLHPIPPGIITKRLIEALNGTDTASDLVLCAECIHRLMDGKQPSRVILAQ